MDSPPAKKFAGGSRSPIENHSNAEEATRKENIPPVATKKSGSVFKKYENYLEEKAKTIHLPTAEESKLTPRFLFDDSVLIVHMCHPCRAVNRALPAIQVDGEYQEMALRLCNICCSTLKAMKTSKFFKHDLPCVKRNSAEK
ncbi:hypothetical protein GCK72_011941 [Caenorhabditis remanei]|uniref:Uncharacterized protein n=2 Tax=Caenorhabditis remanei TaxID=31234 RepID=E3MEN6_CAERE|nr:hypothetical protein GCK72_011941 [Caenorhabditis remanei]EFP00421.1 hypothetical protein CRE_21821 [Caenorhabditis remanei]KAF1755491.1 hypothetical protein GCK72_011941 [Caenorhabditis remanei]